MQLSTRRWGSNSTKAVVCIHGLTQQSEVFDQLGRKLAGLGMHVVAVDLRGHGKSAHDPPWTTQTHVDDMLETLDSMGITQAVFVGHSYGGRVAALSALTDPGRTTGVVLLETPHRLDAERALRTIEIERLDWSFATVDGVLEAVMANELMVKAPRDIVSRFVRHNVVSGPDGRVRLAFSRGAVVVAWNEMALPPVPIAPVPTLLVTAERSLTPCDEGNRAYRSILGQMLTEVKVPNGHNVLWESPNESTEAIVQFLETADMEGEQ